MTDSNSTPGWLPAAVALLGGLVGLYAAVKVAGWIAGLFSTLFAVLVWIVVAIFTLAVVALLVWIACYALVAKLRPEWA